jgi:hypothetical protein
MFSLLNHRIRKIDPSGIITTFGGSGVESRAGTSGPIGSTNLLYPWSIVGDTARTVMYFSDLHYVWKYLYATNIVSVFAHFSSTQGFSGDGGPATSAKLYNPGGLWLTSSGVLYIADFFNNRVRKVSSGIITSVAGSGCCCACVGSFSGDNGRAISATFYGPMSLYMDTNGKLFIADFSNNRIRLVAPTGIITTFAGTGIDSPFNGDNLPALFANLNNPSDVKGDSSGNIYITEYVSCIIRLVDSSGIISTIFGSPGSCGFSSGLSSRSASIFPPSGLWFDSLSNIYIGDLNSVRRGVTVSSPTSQPSSQPTRQPTTQPTAYISGSLTQGLVAYYPFDGNAKDNSGNGNNGVVRGGMVLVADRLGKANSAFSFDGVSGYIEIPGQSFNFPSNLTISFWVKPTVAQVQYARIIDKSVWKAATNKNIAGFQILRINDNNHINELNVYTFLSVCPPMNLTGFPETIIPSDIWSHFTVVKSFDKGFYYLNGVLVLSTTLPAAQWNIVGNGDLPLTVGAANSGQTKPASGLVNFYKGVLDEIFIYNRPLTADEILSLYRFDYPTSQPTSQPSKQPTAKPSCQPSVQPSRQPITTPTMQPTTQPTCRPSCQPSGYPTAETSFQPFSNPTSQPTNQPSCLPTCLPSSMPSTKPSIQPTSFPSNQPISHPSSFPSSQPSSFPSSQPNSEPSGIPSNQPSSAPSSQPSEQPMSYPSCRPTTPPTQQPSGIPSNQPSSMPSCHPTTQPSRQPSNSPTGQPSNQPSTVPSRQPSSQPTTKPTEVPSSIPTTQPSAHPSERPSVIPSGQPSKLPTLQPTSKPSIRPSSDPSAQPSSQPSLLPSTQPTCQPSTKPSAQPTNQPSQQPQAEPSYKPSAQPQALPTADPSNQPSNTPTSQPSRTPSSQPSSQPTKNRMNCLASENKFFSSTKDDCVQCPFHSFLNHTGDETCYCNAGYYQTGFGLSLNCTLCPPGEVSLPGDRNCTQCPRGSFGHPLSHVCELCPVSFYASSSSQTQCQPCPAGRATATTGATSMEQCISPVPNFSLGFIALFVVVVIFSWYIVFGKFQRISFERKVKTVIPNIEKCKQVLIYEEESHYHHLKVVQDKRNRVESKFKFFAFAVISFFLILVSVVLGIIFFTYQVFFTSLILWRGLKDDFDLRPILLLLRRGLKDVIQYVGLPINLFYFAALPFLYLFEALASIKFSLTAVNVTCSGSQAPIELLINCCVLGIVIIVIRSDYQLLFNILLNNLNQRFLLNNLERHLEAANFRFSRYFYLCLAVTGLIVINPFQLGLRYCMGFIEIRAFTANHLVAHKVSEACNQVPTAPYFDSFLGYTSTIFAWWLILPAVYSLAEVVVPKCKKIDPTKKISCKKQSVKTSKISPAEVIDEAIEPSTLEKAIRERKDIEPYEEDDADEISVPEPGSEQKKEDHEQIRRPDPAHLSAKFPGIDEKTLINIYEEGYKDRGRLEKDRQLSNLEIRHEVRNAEEPKIFQQFLKKMPSTFAFYYYFKEKYVLLISVDLWISIVFSSWINLLKKNTLNEGRKPQLLLAKHQRSVSTSQLITSEKQSSMKSPGLKKLFSLNSEEFTRTMHLYDEEQVRKQKKLDFLWQKECGENSRSLPSYYELSLVVRDELHEYILEPVSGLLAFIGIGHFFTPTGRYYWSVVFNNYKIFLLVCFGIWTDEAVDAYGLEETSSRLSVDGRAFLNQKGRNSAVLLEGTGTKKNTTDNFSRSRKFSAQLFGFNILRPEEPIQSKPVRSLSKEVNKQNIREVLPAVISVLICSRVILFQIVPSLVLFSTISMTLASFPLFIFSEFLVETLPPLIIWGEINKEMAICCEMKSFVSLDPQTKEFLSEEETIQVLCNNYSWRLSLRGIKTRGIKAVTIVS